LRPLLAGPLLRRTDHDRLWIWIATSEPVTVTAIVSRFTDDGLDAVGGGQGEAVRLGRRLWVHLVQAQAQTNSWPTDQLLAYDLQLRGQRGAWARDLAALGLLEGEARITYDGLPLPTFFVRKHLPKLNLLHGSCRLLHGLGGDAFLAADSMIARSARDLSDRPGAMFLTGDQVYGDDVAGPLIAHLTAFGNALIGEHDEISVPGLPPLSSLPAYGRQALLGAKAGFTSPKAGNHLASFGEFAAIYLVALNEANWPARWPATREALPDQPDRGLPKVLYNRLRRQYDKEITNLEAARRALPAVRRVLANVPVYMIFDDHDVTDDWNLTQEWYEHVRASATGRRIVTNALATYWAFQGWGNQPASFDPSFKAALSSFALGEDTDVDTLLWDFDQWSYVAPTDPPTVVLNTRTQREFDAPQAAARLIGRQERERVRQLATTTARREGQPLLMVSSVPVFGLELQERREKFLAGKIGPYEIDFEGWHSNLAGLIDFMRLLIEDLGLDRCVLLSGDVHFGINTHTTFEMGIRSTVFAQLVSSSLKHSGRTSKAALELLGHVVKRRHERLGWDSPPRVTRAAGLANRLLGRMVNTDEWSDDAPVFLAPRIVKRMSATTTPDYRECRYYVRPEEAGASVLIGESNVGLVTLATDECVEHRLLSYNKTRLRVRTAHIDLRPSPPATTVSRAQSKRQSR
jgi:PhoD-like phosphatase